ncbi:alpha-1,2-mannosidase, putative [bacterium A37T11]|nr:alpha-1,2-mannosidase, putative [bacterium A37T11]
MKRFNQIPLFFLLLTCTQQEHINQSGKDDILSYVQPLSGTGAATTEAAIKHGGGTELNANTIPAVGLPFGMIQWTPQTQPGETKCVPPYLYKDTKMSGFRGTHWLSGSCVPDYGSFTLMPISGHLKTSLADYAATFSHDDEVSSPHYYKIGLPEYQLKAELTGTLRCGMMQFTLEKDDSLYVLVVPNSEKGKGQISIDAKKGEIIGYNPAYRIYQGSGKPAGFNGYFVIQFEKGFLTSGTFKEKNDGVYAGFRLRKGQSLRVRIGSSFTSLEGAYKNLAAEVADWQFDALIAKNKAVWEKALGQIAVKTPVEKDKRIFYTAMYHALQHPRLYNDVDGLYPKFGQQYQTARLDSGSYYDDFSMWDIYRAQLPLMEILQPELVNNLVRSLILKGQQGGWLPIFPCWNNYTSAMIGDHATAFIASAYAKGLRSYDVAEGYRLMRQNAFEVAPTEAYKNGLGRRALASYLPYHYIPLEDSVRDAFHQREQVSRTLEYAYDDYALATVAKALGKTADFEALLARSKNYRNVFDPAVGLMRGRHADGSWVVPYHPDQKESYITEGTPRQYTFYVPQDVPGLAQLMKGPSYLEKALDTLFATNEYWHGNEPSHQIPFMYNYTPSPWKTQREVRRILQQEYSDGPGGLSGNDDSGQMSAWYVFASLGFYPMDPVSGQYQLSSPLFDEIRIQLPAGKELHIITHKDTEKSIYIKKITWDGAPYTKNYLEHQQLMKGGKIAFYLGEGG